MERIYGQSLKRWVHVDDSKISILTIDQFKDMIEYAKAEINNLEKNYNLPSENMMNVLLDISTKLLEGDYTVAFILSFFTLEQIITDIWYNLTTDIFISEGITSNNQIKERITNNRDRSLSLIIDNLLILGVLTGKEFSYLHKMRKQRNAIAHELLKQNITIPKTRVVSMVDSIFLMLKRINKSNEILKISKEDEIIIDQISAEWHS